MEYTNQLPVGSRSRDNDDDNNDNDQYWNESYPRNLNRGRGRGESTGRDRTGGSAGRGRGRGRPSSPVRRGGLAGGQGHDGSAGGRGAARGGVSVGPNLPRVTRSPSAPVSRTRHTDVATNLSGVVTLNPENFTRHVTNIREFSSTPTTGQRGTFALTETQPLTTEEELKTTNNSSRMTSRSTERLGHVSSHPSLTSLDPYKGNQSTLVLATVPVILIPVIVLLSIWCFWKKLKCRLRNRRKQGHTNDTADVNLKELDPPTTYSSGTEKETKIKSGGVDQNLSHDHLTQRREVEERSPKFPSGSDASSERKGWPHKYEDIPDCNTELYHTVTPEAVSNDFVTSHRQYDLYDKLKRDGNISTVSTGIQDAKNSKYDRLDAISSLQESTKYDILKRDVYRASVETPLPDVTEDAEYSRLNKMPSTSSSSSSYDRLTRNVKIKEELTD